MEDLLTVVGKHEAVSQVLGGEPAVGGLVLWATAALQLVVLEDEPHWLEIQIPDCVEEHLSTVDQEML